MLCVGGRGGAGARPEPRRQGAATGGSGGEGGPRGATRNKNKKNSRLWAATALPCDL